MFMDEKKIILEELMKKEIDELSQKVDNKVKKIKSDKKELIDLNKELRRKRKSYDLYTGNIKKPKPKIKAPIATAPVKL